MTRTRKDCPICGKKGLVKLSNHLADVHKLLSKERQRHFTRAKSTSLCLENITVELYKLIENIKK